MYILAIESSCDETAAAVSKNGREILSNVIFSQAEMHSLYGGVVPEIASRNHTDAICPVVDRAIVESGIKKSELDAIAVTYAPGLIGALLVGVSFAKGLSAALGLPLIPVHHIRGHIAANLIAFPELKPPFICLVASGGHTLLAEVKDYTDMKIIGSTRDDAAGEAFDKAARVLSLPYPGGAMMDKLAKDGNDKAYRFPKAEVSGFPYDFSFSGLKTAVINTVHNCEQKGEILDREGLAASFCRAVADALVPRAIGAVNEFSPDNRVLAVAGGVAANSVLRRALAEECKKQNITLYLPPLSLCGDNAAMIACQGYYEYLAGNLASSDLNGYATMSIEFTL
ncbi:MAG: tRNA (adenosine(37)-N6)-threonylcarbamoyltransferase complex transferase subunit TsaD [Clostridiales bacterium]|nr:tRNA (adenosine(37)-N6)-threonylcarbamoyltransferase complex transferase subunit TsaD [Clostridiales bacterium]